MAKVSRPRSYEPAKIFDEEWVLRTEGAGRPIGKRRALLGLPGAGLLGEIPLEPGTIPQMLAEEPLRVLVVEDEALLRWSLAEILRRRGHTVIETSSAGGAREAIGSTPAPVDIVFLDYRLPDSNDLRLLEEIRKNMPRSAVVLMTAYATTEVVEGALERGAYCVLSKPFDLFDVTVLVENARRTIRPH